MREFSRSQRVGEQIQRQLARLIQHEMNDPRIGMLTLVSVEVNRNFEQAKVYFTLLGSDQHSDSISASSDSISASKEPRDIEKILNKASGFLRYKLGPHLCIRNIPRLKFIYDSSVAAGQSLSKLIDTAVKSERNLYSSH